MYDENAIKNEYVARFMGHARWPQVVVLKVHLIKFSKLFVLMDETAAILVVKWLGPSYNVDHSYTMYLSSLSVRTRSIDV